MIKETGSGILRGYRLPIRNARWYQRLSRVCAGGRGCYNKKGLSRNKTWQTGVSEILCPWDFLHAMTNRKKVKNKEQKKKTIYLSSTKSGSNETKYKEKPNSDKIKGARNQLEFIYHDSIKLPDSTSCFHFFSFFFYYLFFFFTFFLVTKGILMSTSFELASE